jgi:hypothetical protein
MHSDTLEAVYLQRRIDASIAMARAAKSNCAKVVHDALADRYRRKLVTLKRVSQARLLSAPVREDRGPPHW